MWGANNRGGRSKATHGQAGGSNLRCQKKRGFVVQPTPGFNKNYPEATVQKSMKCLMDISDLRTHASPLGTTTHEDE